ncbi:MAG: hypothetical protein WAN51_12925 [Alphaproteobacteria bacterium]
MRKFLTGTICAAVLTAASVGLAMAQQYPMCTSKSDDKCMQGTGTMPSAAKSSMQMGKHKGMHKGAMKSGGMMKKTTGTGAAGESNIPHGCSPATTPCE